MVKSYRSILLQSVCLALLLCLPLWSQDNPRPVRKSLRVPQDSLVTIFLTNNISLENFLIVKTGDVWVLHNSNRVSQEISSRDIFRVVKDGIDISDQYPSIGGTELPPAFSPRVDLLIKVAIGAVLAGVAWMVIGTGLGY